jgi:ferredoxin
MAVVTLTINDEMVSAQEGETLLSVLRERGIDMPTLCHLDGLSERGGCRLCMVEMEGNRAPASGVCDAGAGRYGGPHAQRAPGQISPDDPGTALLPNATMCAPSA